MCHLDLRLCCYLRVLDYISLMFSSALLSNIPHVCELNHILCMWFNSAPSCKNKLEPDYWFSTCVEWYFPNSYILQIEHILALHKIHSSPIIVIIIKRTNLYLIHFQQLNKVFLPWSVASLITHIEYKYFQLTVHFA